MGTEESQIRVVLSHSDTLYSLYSQEMRMVRFGMVKLVSVFVLGWILHFRDGLTWGWGLGRLEQRLLRDGVGETIRNSCDPCVTVRGSRGIPVEGEKETKKGFSTRVTPEESSGINFRVRNRGF